MVKGIQKKTIMNMLEIIKNDIRIAPKTLHCLIFDKIKNGIELNEKEYKYWPKIKWKIEKFELIENGCILYYSWGKEYFKNGKVHRDNGPAFIGSDGYKAYLRNGLLHNDDGPAVIRSDGSEFYYKNGLRHNDNGPAFIGSDGYKEYWLNGVKYSEKEYLKYVRDNRK